jgi:hypothetical protein
MHMSVSEHKQAFYCYRNTQHQGKNIVYLLGGLGIGAREAERLINQFGGKQIIRERPPEAPLEIAAVDRAWRRFEPASQDARMLAYLKNRGFPSPAMTCATYGLRYATQGAWACRLLMPFKDAQGDVYTWVGRDITGQLDPKYRMNDERLPGAFYMPRGPRKYGILVEGPLDALKIAVGAEDLDISPIAVAGKGLNASKLVRMSDMLGSTSLVFEAMDSDVPFSERMALRRELRGGLGRPLFNAPLPDGYKDPGEMPVALIRQWIEGLIKKAEDA